MSNITKVEGYYLPILQSLYELGGSGQVDEVLAIVERKMKPKMSHADKETLGSGYEIRWRNMARWARQHLKMQGLLRDDSPRGIWELTDAGVKVVENARS